MIFHRLSERRTFHVYSLGHIKKGYFHEYYVDSLFPGVYA